MLDTRLKMIYDLIPNGIVCDVGTDHGKLPVFCVKSKKSEKAYACDINEGPLSAASRLIKKEGLEGKITTVLSDGFKAVPGDAFESVDTFVLAGMGGELIMSILSARFTNAKLVLSPQSAVYELCEWLAQNGYNIAERVFCKDGGRFYTAMLVEYDGIKRDTDLFVACKKDGVFYEYLEKEKTRLEKARRAICESEKSDKSRLEQIDFVLSEIERYKK